MNATMITASVSAGSISGKSSSPEHCNGENGVFGSVLKSALSGKKEANSTAPSSISEQKLTSEEQAVIKDLLEFLQITDLSQLEGGFSLAQDVMVLGSNITAHPFIQALFGIKEGSSLLSALNSLTAGIGMQQEGEEVDETQAELTLEAMIAAVQTFLEKITAKLEGKRNNIELADAAGILKMAKIQELLTSYKDLSKDDASLSSKLKELLESAQAKISALIKDNGTKNSAEGSFAKIFPGIQNQESANWGLTADAETVQQAFQRNLGEMNSSVNKTTEENADKTLGQIKGSEGTSSFLPLQTTKVEQLVLKLEKNGQPVNQEQFIREFQNLLGKAKFSSSGGIQKLFIRLNPEHLGSIRIELVQKDNQLTAKILATTARAKEMLDSQLQGLKHAFSGQNLQVEKIEISQQMNHFSQERFLQREQGNPQQQRSSQELQQQEEDVENINGFSESFEEALLNTKV
ncbi:hypothetical protein CVD28_16515 [Bacillus sp. M6-12]|uniref:flagellar hook-length control protein FliK n=1 Tax=Bacillus sp. M6-12 TaxID=2054166 RepID=UPI000C78C1C7|nr:flagellar hook-length control protein FliK [Bacillus sp. M6-12]PLS16679.1 hypothetical protein CVD28_16515 [Bacillus sp. M6-12]